MKIRTRWAAMLAMIVVAGALGAGCGDDEEPSSSAGTDATPSAGESTPAADVLGTPNKASGDPLVFGLLNLESGPVTFPEYRQAAEAAVKYINEYKGGIGGRPVELATCATDGQPATSGRCANQIVDKKPVAVLGGADIGAPGSVPVWQRAGLASIGGIPFTPAESNYENGVIFISISVGDNAATVSYAAEDLGVKKMSVLYTDDTQGKFTGLGVIAATAKELGIDVETVPVAPNAADLSSVAASAISSGPDMVYVNSPNACAALLKALKSVGNTAKLAGIDPCTSPQSIETAGDAIEGMYFGQPFESLDSGSEDANLMIAAVQKFGEKGIPLDSIAQAGFASVMNLQAALDDVKELDTKSILAAFKEGENHANFLAHEYTCDGKQQPGSTAVCNTYQLIKQVKEGKIATVSDEWVSGTENFTPPAG